MRTTPVPPAEKYVEAFRQVLPTLSPGRRKMLEAHYRAPDRTLTPAALAKAADYKNESAVNMQYGALASEVADAIGYEATEKRVRNAKESFKTYTLAAWEPRSRAWVMHPEVAEALKSLGW